MNRNAIKYPEVIQMLWYAAVGMLAAFGAFCALWTIWGWMLPKGKGWVILCLEEPEGKIPAGVKWLRDLGFQKTPVIVVTEKPGGASPGVENCSWDELISWLEWERNRFDGTGNGDHTGRHQRRGISEL